jgi:PST family polysaccharide transporter
MRTQRDILFRYAILFSSHLFSVLTPLIVFPHLVREMGETDFGKVLFIQTLVSYFIVLVDYDFNLWGVKELVRSRDEERIYTDVVNSKLVLCAVSVFLYLVIAFLFFSKIENSALVLSGSIVIVSYVFNPIWFYQGKEQVWSMALINIASKLVFLLGSYAFIESVDSAWLYNLFFGLGLILPGSFVFYKKYEWKTSYLNFRRGLDVFLSNLAILIYSNSSPLWIALFLPVSAVTQFSVAEKLVFASRGFMSLYAQVIYPKLCHPDGESKDLQKSHLIFVLMTFLGGILLTFIAPYVTSYFLGNTQEEVVFILRTMAFLPTIIVANIYPYQWLLAHSHYKVTKKVLFLGALVGILLFPSMIYFLHLWGAVIASFVVELIITGMLIYYYFKLKDYHV